MQLTLLLSTWCQFDHWFLVQWKSPLTPLFYLLLCDNAVRFPYELEFFAHNKDNTCLYFLNSIVFWHDSNIGNIWNYFLFLTVVQYKSVPEDTPWYAMCEGFFMLCGFVCARLYRDCYEHCSLRLWNKACNCESLRATACCITVVILEVSVQSLVVIRHAPWYPEKLFNFISISFLNRFF